MSSELVQGDTSPKSPALVYLASKPLRDTKRNSPEYFYIFILETKQA